MRFDRRKAHRPTQRLRDELGDLGLEATHADERRHDEDKNQDRNGRENYSQTPPQSFLASGAISHCI
jgi:hypothetical protein